MKTLHLTLTRNWFDKIASGEKKEDFLVLKNYWSSRLCSMGCKIERAKDIDTAEIYFKYFDLVKITAGYGKDKPTLTARCTGIRITADDEQTDLGTGSFFAIGIGEILEKENV